MIDKPNTQNSSSTWSERWFRLLAEQGLESHLLRRGRSYVRRGRVRAVEIQVGRVSAQVEETGREPCQVSVWVERLSDPEWNQVLDVMGSQALFAAQLLTGDMPAQVEELFTLAGASLLPSAQEMEHRCSCCQTSKEQPCQHVAAVHHLLGRMLDDDPWLLLRLRGRDRQQILQALRQRRSNGSESPGALPLPPEEGSPFLFGQRTPASQEGGSPALTSQLDRYWGRAKELSNLHHHIAPPSIRLALLRRLGHPPFLTESFETYEALVEIYEQVTRQALDMAYATEPEENGSGARDESHGQAIDSPETRWRATDSPERSWRPGNGSRGKGNPIQPKPTQRKGME